MLLAYRVYSKAWKGDRSFDRLLELLSAYPGAADEVSLFDETFPLIAYTPLEDVEQTAALLKQRIAELRRVEFRSVGINVLFTLGHGDSPGGFDRTLPFQPMVGHDGQVSTGSLCPNTSEFRIYTQQRYALLAAAQPDFVWVDDDLRMSHHGPTYPCFCPTCLAKFGHGTDREELVARLNEPEHGDLRRAWTEFCAASLESLCVDIREAVAGVDPEIELGLMTIGYSHSTYGGHPVGRWIEALGARRARPGHGYYMDQVPRLLLNKAMDVGRLIREYPFEVETIQYELENYPYIFLDKARQTILNECTMAIMMGCNGIAFNLLRSEPGTLEDFDPTLCAIAAERPAWAALAEAAAELPLVGFWPADNTQLMANRDVDASGWFREDGSYDMQRPNPLAEVGLPLAVDGSTACGVLLAGRIAEAFSTEELRRILAGGVLLDAAALRVLWARGLGGLTGVRPGEGFPNGVMERFTEHPLNGRYAGDGRDALVGPDDSTYSLIPIEEGVGDLAHLVRYGGADAGCCFAIYANELGGHVAVSSYAPWRQLGRGSKRHQVLAVADWLSGGRLPVWIEQTVRVAPFVRRSTDGRRICVVLANMGLDPTGTLRMRLRAFPEQVAWMSPDGALRLPVERGEDEVVVTVPSIPAWQTAILIGDS